MSFRLLPFITLHIFKGSSRFFLDRSRSTSRERKRGRWEEEKERRSEGSSGPSRARSHSSVRSRDSEEAFGDRERQRDREKGDDERDEEEFLKPAWIRCTHAENYFSNDPMDQVVVPRPSLEFTHKRDILCLISSAVFLLNNSIVLLFC